MNDENRYPVPFFSIKRMRQKIFCRIFLFRLLSEAFNISLGARIVSYRMNDMDTGCKSQNTRLTHDVQCNFILAIDTANSEPNFLFLCSESHFSQSRAKTIDTNSHLRGGDERLFLGLSISIYVSACVSSSKKKHKWNTAIYQNVPYKQWISYFIFHSKIALSNQQRNAMAVPEHNLFVYSMRRRQNSTCST